MGDDNEQSLSLDMGLDMGIVAAPVERQPGHRANSRADALERDLDTPHFTIRMPVSIRSIGGAPRVCCHSASTTQ